MVSIFFKLALKSLNSLNNNNYEKINYSSRSHSHDTQCFCTNVYMEKWDKSKLTFYLACKKCLEAVINHAENYADTAAELAGKETDPIRRYELNNISKICRRVPRYPAESFYEAVQSVHFITYCLTLTPLRMIYDMQYQQGRPDRYLFKYYLWLLVSSFLLFCLCYFSKRISKSYFPPWINLPANIFIFSRSKGTCSMNSSSE